MANRKAVLVFASTLVAAGIFGVFMFMHRNNKSQNIEAGTKNAETAKSDMEPTPNVPENAALYENKTLGVRVFYPKNYTKVQDEMYPVPIATFISPECNKDLRWPTGDELGKCSILNIWQQSKPYGFNESSSNFSRNEPVRLGNIEGTIKTYERFGTEITTVQFPRYDTNDRQKKIGELIIQYSYGVQNAEQADEGTKTILKKLAVGRSYVFVNPPSCCEEKVPPILVHGAKKFWLFSHNQLTEIPVSLSDLTGGEKISPDGSKIAFLHWDYDRDRGGLFSSAKTGIAIVDTSPPFNFIELVRPGIDSYTYLSWSPSGRYLSYALNDGKGIGMIDMTTKEEMFRLVSRYDGDAGLVKWLNNDQFSFIYEDLLYVGTPDNPTGKKVAEKAISSETEFESQPSLFMPYWSLDGKYVMYRGEDSAIILNTETNEIYRFGKKEESEFGPYLSISEVGWTADNNFLYVEDGFLKSAKIVADNLVIQNLKGASADSENYKLIGSGPYVAAYSGSLNERLTILDVDQRIAVCPDIRAGKFYASFVSPTDQAVYVVSNPLVPKWLQWPNNYGQATNQAARMLEIFDVKSCKSLGGFVVGEDMDLNVQFAHNL